MWQLKFWIESNATASAHTNIATSCRNVNSGMAELSSFILLLLNEKNIRSKTQQPTELHLWDNDIQAS
jgi:hypothetical protein